MLLMGGNLLSFSPKQSPSNSYRDSDSNPYSTKVVFFNGSHSISPESYKARL
jgi:hypothetical protein